MAIVVGIPVLLFLALLAYGGLTGRIKFSAGSGCCAPADPAKDLRMRSAFEDESPPAAPSARSGNPS